MLSRGDTVSVPYAVLSSPVPKLVVSWWGPSKHTLPECRLFWAAKLEISASCKLNMDVEEREEKQC